MARAETERQRQGNAAEAEACAHLQRQGLQLVARNVRYPFGEIDLVMLAATTVVFVEVRFRKSIAFGGGAVSVDAGKRRKIALAAQAWLATNPKHAKAPCRFDVVAVSPEADGLRCEWIAAAFTLDDMG